MAKMNSKFKYMFDAAPSVRLIARDNVAKTANFNSSPVTLDKLEGHWTSNELADQTFALVVNVTDIAASARTATITLTSVVATDQITFNDGVNAPITLEADDDFAVGGSNNATAVNLAEAINDLYDAGDLLFSAIASTNTVIVTDHTGATGQITEAETTIAVTAFAGNNETYAFAVQVGPVGFGSNAVLGTLNISRPGQYVFPVDLDTAIAMKSDTAAIRLVGTLAGVAPSITLYSWIAGRILR